MGSRSELILFVATLIGAYYLINSKKVSGIFYLGITTFTTAILVFLNWANISVLLEDTRLYDLLYYGIFNSSSGAMRLEFTKAALHYIEISPFWGNYGIYVKHFGSVGSYPHNILSAWLNIGLLGLLVYLYLIFNILYFSMRRVLDIGDEYSRLSLIMSLFIFFSFFTSKDYLFMFFGLSIGLYLNIYKKVL